MVDFLFAFSRYLREIGTCQFRRSLAIISAAALAGCGDGNYVDPNGSLPQGEVTFPTQTTSSQLVENCGPNERKLTIFDDFPYYLIVRPATLIDRQILEKEHWIEKGWADIDSQSLGFLADLREYRLASAYYYSGKDFERVEQFENPEYQVAAFRKFYDSYESNLRSQGRIMALSEAESRVNRQRYDIMASIASDILMVSAINASLSSGDEAYFRSAVLKVFEGYREYSDVAHDLPIINYPSDPIFDGFEPLHLQLVHGPFDNVWRIATMKLYLDLLPQQAVDYYPHVARFGRKPITREDGSAYFLEAEFRRDQIHDFMKNGICLYPYRRAVWDYLFYRKALGDDRQDVNIDQSEQIYLKTVSD